VRHLERPYIIVIEAPRFAPDGYPIEIGIAMDLSRLLFGKMVYSDGWVVDQPWLTKLFYAAHVPQDFRISALELILTEAQMAIWHDTKDRLVREMHLHRHRASDDAQLIQETYIQTLHETGEA